MPPTGYNRDTFGLPEPVPEGQEDEFAFLNADTDQEPTPAESESQGEPGGEVLDQAAQEATQEPVAEEQPQATETPAEVAERLWANKYKSPEELEKGYRNLSDLDRRRAQAQRVAEEQAAKAVARAQELETILRQAVPYVEAAMSQQTRVAPVQSTDPWTEGEAPQPQPQIDPRTLQAYIDNTVAQRLASYQGQIKAEMDAQAAFEEANGAVADFYENHPEVEMYGPVDGQITQVVQDLNQVWQRRGYTGFDIGDPDMLEVAYEAVKNPELKSVLELHPEYTETDAGMNIARFEAGLIRGDGSITQQTARVPASQVGQRVTPPVTESASTGGTPEGTNRPLNEFEQAVLDYRRNKKGGLGDSVFG